MDQGGAGKFEFQNWIYLGMFFIGWSELNRHQKFEHTKKIGIFCFVFRSLLNKLMYKNGTKNAVDWEERLAHLIIFFFKLFSLNFARSTKEI